MRRIVSGKTSRAIALAAVLMLCAPVALADVGPETEAASASAQAPVPLLWKVSDADNAVYLLGSFHLLRPSDYPLAAEVDAAFADAESVLFELSPEEMNSPAMSMKMLQAGMRSDGTQLRDDLDPRTWAELQAYAQRNGLPLEGLSNFEPWFAGLTLSLFELTRQGLDPKLGLDRHFAEAAQAAGKPTAGLERGDEQIAMLDGMDPADQKQFLAEALENAVDGKSESAKLHAAWRAGDADGLFNGMATEMKREYPRLYQRINVARNDAWVPRIARLLDESRADDVLVVVGALHLLGPDGVVEKLRVKGYRVERICSACK